ncbi:squidulin-like isoform X2 [Mercenaria mercenaria]|uniref:squidulin-like isoform X2 n=1 Tax=Mercenaria mercenaria TaxID=6596 RepID=UPI001E1DE1DA|nr:squidulin-like isoform X2 [Mercenaria mercenaria]
MSGEIKEACARAFASVDVNGRGYISRDQMIMALRILNFNPIDSEVEEMLQENDNKSFTYDQFVDFVTDMKLPSLEEQKMDLREAFALFDRMNTELEELFVNDEDVQSIMDAQSWEMV